MKRTEERAALRRARPSEAESVGVTIEVVENEVFVVAGNTHRANTA